MKSFRKHLRKNKKSKKNKKGGMFGIGWRQTSDESGTPAIVPPPLPRPMGEPITEEVLQELRKDAEKNSYINFPPDKDEQIGNIKKSQTAWIRPLDIEINVEMLKFAIAEPGHQERITDHMRELISSYRQKATNEQQFEQIANLELKLKQTRDRRKDYGSRAEVSTSAQTVSRPRSSFSLKGRSQSIGSAGREPATKFSRPSPY